MKRIHVSKTDPTAFSSLQEAVLSIPDNRTETVEIFVAPGIYEEKVFIRKENIKIIGEDPETTIFRYGDGAKKPREDGDGEYGTFNTAVILLAGKDIAVKNITIENTAGPGYRAGQALALYVGSDRTSFYNCRFLGYQDTIFAGEPVTCRMKKLILPDYFQKSPVFIDYQVIRNYFYNCFISGDVDFIFGPNVAYFDHCIIHSKKRESEPKSFITAASTPAGQEFGMVFVDCTLTGEAETNSVYLGRPWRDYAKTAFVRCHMDAHIRREGWENWGKPKAEAVCSYIEYNCSGPGYNPSQRANFSKQLTNPGLEEYFSLQNVLSGDDEWVPELCKNFS